MVKKICGPKMEEVTGNWSNLHNEELHDLYFSPDIVGVITIKEDKMGGTCVTYRGGGGAKICIQNLVGKPEGKRQLGRPRCKGESVPLQARRGPEDSRELRFPDFVTMAQDGGR